MEFNFNATEGSVELFFDALHKDDLIVSWERWIPPKQRYLHSSSLPEIFGGEAAHFYVVDPDWVEEEQPVISYFARYCQRTGFALSAFGGPYLEVSVWMNPLRVNVSMRGKYIIPSRKTIKPGVSIAAYFRKLRKEFTV